MFVASQVAQGSQEPPFNVTKTAAVYHHNKLTIYAGLYWDQPSQSVIGGYNLCASENVFVRIRPRCVFACVRVPVWLWSVVDGNQLSALPREGPALACEWDPTFPKRTKMTSAGWRIHTMCAMWWEVRASLDSMLCSNIFVWCGLFSGIRHAFFERVYTLSMSPCVWSSIETFDGW